MSNSEQPTEITIFRRVYQLFNNNAEKLAEALQTYAGYDCDAHRLQSLATRTDLRVNEEFVEIVTAMGKLPRMKQVLGAAKRPKARRHRIPLTPERRTCFQNELRRTGLSAAHIERALHEINFVAQELNRWSSSRIKTVDKSRWEAVIAYLKCIPDARHARGSGQSSRRKTEPRFWDLAIDKIQPMPEWKPLSPRGLAIIESRKDGSVPISKKCYERLHAERRRTLVSPRRLLEIFSDHPKILHAKTVQNWFRSVTRSGDPALLKWVLAAYEQLPDAET